MPIDTVRRIEASLSALPPMSQARIGPTGWPPQSARRRPSSRSIGALAAGFLVIAGAGVVGIGHLQAASPNDAPMAIGPRASAAGAGSGAGSGAEGQPGVGAVAPRSASVRTFVATGTRYVKGSLAAQAARTWSDPGPPLSPRAAEQPGIGPLATELGLADCLSALQAGAPSQVMVDFALYEGEPVAVVLTRTGDGVQVQVTQRSCGAAQPHRLEGPLPVAVP